MRRCWNAAPYQRGLGVDKEEEEKGGRKKKPSFPSSPLFFLPPSPFTSPPLPPSLHCKWVWSLSDVIQLISLRFNYKRKHPSYPSPLDRGSTFSNKLPLVSQESLNYRFYSLFAPFPSLRFASLLRSVLFSGTGLLHCCPRSVFTQSNSIESDSFLLFAYFKSHGNWKHSIWFVWFFIKNNTF